jgi:DnaJ-class molecular chaperone
MRIHEIIALCDKYGENTTLAEIRQSIQGKKKHLCPKCNGTGSVLREFYRYPTIYLGSSPDGVTYRQYGCDLCNGEGYIDKSTANKVQENITQDYNYVHLC